MASHQSFKTNHYRIEKLIAHVLRLSINFQKITTSLMKPNFSLENVTIYNRLFQNVFANIKLNTVRENTSHSICEFNKDVQIRNILVDGFTFQVPSWHHYTCLVVCIYIHGIYLCEMLSSHQAFTFLVKGKWKRTYRTFRRIHTSLRTE